jgi:hypothetical protein
MKYGSGNGVGGRYGARHVHAFIVNLVIAIIIGGLMIKIIFF